LHGFEPDDLFEQEIDSWSTADEQKSLKQDSSITPDPAKKYRDNQLRVVRESRDYQLDFLQHALMPGREIIDISPAYQRRLRWDRKKKSLLIESFLMNIPVPPIFMFERDYNEFEVIDGRQRLDSIKSFLSNDFALIGLEYWPELNGSRFQDLPPVLKKGLLRRSLNAVILLAESSEGENEQDETGIDVRRVLFDRLNTGGIRLNPQELRNALYPGSLNGLLVRLSRSKAFTQTWGIPPYRAGEEENPPKELLDNRLYATLADCELVLRVFAIRDAVENERSGALRSILDRYMEANKDIEERESSRMDDEFSNVLEELLEVFRDDLFILPSTGRHSRPLYDALMVSQLLHYQPLRGRSAAVRSAVEAALNSNESYEILVGRANTMEALRERVALAGNLLGAL